MRASCAPGVKLGAPARPFAGEPVVEIGAGVTDPAVADALGARSDRLRRAAAR